MTSPHRGKSTVRILVIGYDLNYLYAIFTDIEVLVTDAIDKEYVMLLGGNYILILDRGYRRQVMEEFCFACSMDIACGVFDTNMWT